MSREQYPWIIRLCSQISLIVMFAFLVHWTLLIKTLKRSGEDCKREKQNTRIDSKTLEAFSIVVYSLCADRWIFISERTAGRWKIAKTIFNPTIPAYRGKIYSTWFIVTDQKAYHVSWLRSVENMRRGWIESSLVPDGKLSAVQLKIPIHSSVDRCLLFSLPIRRCFAQRTSHRSASLAVDSVILSAYRDTISSLFFSTLFIIGSEFDTSDCGS